MKLNYRTPLLQISLISEEDVIRTSGEVEEIQARMRFASGEQGGNAANLQDYIGQ